ncbi:shikimate kinase [Kribbella lupini]|uniref:shikimate kinase n=1 Tax=Kribbella lupini TaxID=291602 RepID=UPI0031DC5766
MNEPGVGSADAAEATPADAAPAAAAGAAPASADAASAVPAGAAAGSAASADTAATDAVSAAPAGAPASADAASAASAGASAGPVVVLVGPPGSGKSTVAELLAAKLGAVHRDTDTDVETGAGKPISDIFVDSGEPVFRELERAAIVAALKADGVVLSLGGGAILDADTRADLAGHTVVFLDVSVGEAAKRVGLGVARPLLLGNVRTQLKNLMDARRPLYAEVAKHTVTTDGRTPEEIANEIVEHLG